MLRRTVMLSWGGRLRARRPHLQPYTTPLRGVVALTQALRCVLYGTGGGYSPYSGHRSRGPLSSLVHPVAAGEKSNAESHTCAPPQDPQTAPQEPWQHAIRRELQQYYTMDEHDSLSRPDLRYNESLYSPREELQNRTRHGSRLGDTQNSLTVHSSSSLVKATTTTAPTALADTFDPSRSERVEQVEEGIYVYTNSADDLGFHLPPHFLLSAKAQGSMRHLIFNEAVPVTSPMCGGEEAGKANHKSGGAAGSGDGGTGSAGNDDSGRHTVDGSDNDECDADLSFAFGQVVAAFAVSPVVSAFGGLWQWRAVRLAWDERERARLHKSRAATAKGAEAKKHSSVIGQEPVRNASHSSSDHGSPMYPSSSSVTRLHMLPFLLLPVEVRITTREGGSTSSVGARVAEANCWVHPTHRRRIHETLAAMPALHPNALCELLASDIRKETASSVDATMDRSSDTDASFQVNENALCAELAKSTSVSMLSALGEIDVTVGTAVPPAFARALSVSSTARSARCSPQLTVAQACLAAKEDWLEKLLSLTVGAEKGTSGTATTTSSGYTEVHQAGDVAALPIMGSATTTVPSKLGGGDSSLAGTAAVSSSGVREDENHHREAHRMACAFMFPILVEQTHHVSRRVSAANSTVDVSASHVQGERPSLSRREQTFTADVNAASTAAITSAHSVSNPSRPQQHEWRHQQKQQHPTQSSSSPLPQHYRNVIPAPLAEVILSVDRYAALIVRRELTFAAACHALITDMTVVTHLNTPLREHANAFAYHDFKQQQQRQQHGESKDAAPCFAAVAALETELLAAVQAQRTLATLALKRNRTQVGKSCSTTISLDGIVAK